MRWMKGEGINEKWETKLTPFDPQDNRRIHFYDVRLSSHQPHGAGPFNFLLPIIWSSAITRESLSEINGLSWVGMWRKFNNSIRRKITRSGRIVRFALEISRGGVVAIPLVWKEEIEERWKNERMTKEKTLLSMNKKPSRKKQEKLLERTGTLHPLS